MRILFSTFLVLFSFIAKADLQYGFTNNVVYKRDSTGTIYWAKGVSCQWGQFATNAVTDVNRSGDKVYVISQQLNLYGPRGIIVLDTNGNFINASYHMDNDYLLFSLVKPSLFSGGWLVSGTGTSHSRIQLMKFDANGHVDSTARVSTSFEWDAFKKVVNTADSGAVILTLGFNSMETKHYAIVTKVDKYCHMIWHYAFYDQNLSIPIEFGPESMAIDTAGYIYIKGKMYNDVEYGHYLMKLDGNGNEIVTRYWSNAHFFNAVDLYFKDNELTLLNFNNGLQQYLTFRLDSSLNNSCYPYDSTITIPRISLPVTTGNSSFTDSHDTVYVCPNSTASATPFSTTTDYCNLLSVEESSVNAFILYPNPASELLYLNFDDSHKAESVIIYNASGQKVSDIGFQKEINISSLVPGIYTICIKSGDHLVTSRFIKTEQ